MAHSLFRSVVSQIIVISLLVFLSILGLRWGGYLERAELDAYDWSMRLRPPKTGLNPPITLITITDKDIRDLGHWPVTDAVLAQALNIVMHYHPRAIGVDIYRDLEVPPGREELNSVLSQHPEIISIMKFGSIGKGGIPGPPIVGDTDRVGFSDMVVDPGGIVRRGLLFLDDGMHFYRSFSLLLALQYLQQEGIVPKAAVNNPDWVQLGRAVFQPFEPDDGSYRKADAQGYQFLLDLDREGHGFPVISFGAVLAEDFKPELLQDHIVLIGVVAQGVKDYFYTSQCGTLTECPPLPGIELHAYMVRQLIRAAQEEGQAPIATFSDGLESVWMGVWVLGGALLGVWVRGAWRFSVAVLAGIGILWGVVMIGMIEGKWIPFVPAAIGCIVNATVVTALLSNREKQDRMVLMSLFSRHVSPEVAQAVWAYRDQFLENGRWRPKKLVVTTLFSDLEGFTPVAENMEPHQLMDWLNIYLETMVTIIVEHGGIVDDYYGDMIKADFGVLRIGQTEEDIQRDATKAVECARGMEQALIRLNAGWQQQGLPVVRMRIGINTGPVVAGSLGSAQRLKFTTVGDSVNIAARLESFEKDSPETWETDGVCRILIGEPTKQCVGEFSGGIKEIGVVRLKGKAIGIPVYKLLVHTSRFDHSPSLPLMEHVSE